MQVENDPRYGRSIRGVLQPMLCSIPENLCIPCMLSVSDQLQLELWSKESSKTCWGFLFPRDLSKVR
jgi:hypothetical protein